MLLYVIYIYYMQDINNVSEMCQHETVLQNFQDSLFWVITQEQIQVALNDMFHCGNNFMNIFMNKRKSYIHQGTCQIQGWRFK